MSIQTRTVEYTDGDTVFEGYLAYDDTKSGPQPAVAIAHAWAGRDEFECGRARALAELGYVGFAMDFYGKGVLGSGPEENAKLMQPFLEDRPMLQRRLQLGLETLRGQAEADKRRMAAIGYCLGGLCVLDLARIGADLRGVVSFHGIFSPPGNTQGNKIATKVLALHGDMDPMAPREQVVEFEKELTEAGADWQIHVYGNTWHAFTHPQANNPELGAIYNETAERRSWMAMRNFLAEIL